MIKGLRRSLKSDKGTNVQHISASPKSPQSTSSKKNNVNEPDTSSSFKVIKAIRDYKPVHAGELAFSKGDFFHVVSHDDDPDYYEAVNPITHAQGMVPVSHFQIVGKTGRDSQGSTGSDNRKTDDSGYSGSSTLSDSLTRGHKARKSISTKPGGPLYGIVVYDFHAERPDELQATAGEAIIVIAQSNSEWFLAKPIGRLGGPGLIPVSFIEIRDMATGLPVENQEEAISKAQVPRVEEWKRQAANYKNSSISLGKFEFGEQPAPLLAPVAASVESYAYDNGRYWYLVRCQMEDGRTWHLCRFYEDFYDFQIALLKAFPREAGTTGEPRILPYMPGPVHYVTDSLSSQRRQSLDDYIKKLISMDPEISRCELVRQLFVPRQGDVDVTDSIRESTYSGSTYVAQQHQSLASQSMASQNRDSHLSNVSSDSSPAPSRQGSRADLASNMRGNGSYPSILSPPPAQRTHQMRTPTSTNGHPREIHMRSNSDMRPPQMARADSNLSAITAISGGSASGTFMKVKVHYQDDLIAIRLPIDIPFASLQEKLETRLDTKLACIQYRDEQTSEYYDIISDHDLNTAIQRNPKLVLSVS
ncbi:bud emergence protein 1 [Orbilia ellipsospora]|uniref:Bud emergence protein 1 n=1 Tax=Orbilia ellipsospora TaxID=2528407 RepID=A0AAV9X162_9PEZI